MRSRLLRFLALFHLAISPVGAQAGEGATQIPTPSWWPTAPALPPAAGEVVRVVTVEDLFAAVERAKPGATISLADGRYKMPRYLEIRTDNLTLRGESGNRDRVILDGAESRHGDLLGIARCSGVTIADLTIQSIQANGFKINSNTNVQRVTIYNCVIHNIWQRGVKGVSPPQDAARDFRPTDCRVQFCLFYNDRAKRFADDRRDTTQTFQGNYVGGIDVMGAKNWMISDNIFVGIQGRTRSARGAVFLWQNTEGCTIERNVFIDCDVAIALGNSYRPEHIAVHCTRCTVRNNFVARAPESGILADYTRDCTIAHNTIHDPANRLQRLIRLVHENDGLLVAGNLLCGPPMRVETTSVVRLRSNVTKDLSDVFVSAREGNLHLRAELPGVTDRAERLEQVSDDIDKQPRGVNPDIGADER